MRRAGKSNVDCLIELKFFKTELPNLSSLMEPSQKASFIEYHKAGGRKRLLLACNGSGHVHLFATGDVVGNLLSGEARAGFTTCDLYGGVGDFSFANWLPFCLENLCG